MTVKSDNGAPTVTAPAEKPPYLHLRKQTYYFKRKVPTYAAAAFSTNPVWKSLNTSDFEEACKALEKANADFEGLCAQARAKSSREKAAVEKARTRQPGASKYLIPEYIPLIIQRFEHSFLVMDDEERKSLRAPEDSDDERSLAERIHARAEELEETLAEYRTWAAVEDWEAVDDTASALLEQERLIAPPGSKVREELLKQLLHKEIEVLTQQLKRLKGDGKVTPPANHYPTAPRALPTMRDLFL